MRSVARVNSTLIRQINRNRIFHALRLHPHSAQRDLGQLTGLDKATVSAVVAQLLEEGMIERSVRPRARRVGRPETGVRIAPSAGVLIGARLEPTTVRIVATTLAGEILDRVQIPGSRDIGEAVERLRDGVARAVAACGRAGPVRGIGVGIPALMDLGGHLVLAPNLGWRDAPIRPMLQSALGAPVYVDNDTKAAAVAERLFGTGRNVDDYVFLTGHSGVGGALFLGGRLYRGTGGLAGEIGHVTVVPDGRPCGCGKRGCLETYVSEASILARVAELGVQLPDLASVADLARGGDQRVRAVLEEAGDHLGATLASIVNLLNPRMIVFGGNLALVTEFVLPAVRQRLKANALATPLAQTQLLVSSLGADAVPMGGIALALEGFLAQAETRPSGREAGPAAERTVDRLAPTG